MATAASFSVPGQRSLFRPPPGSWNAGSNPSYRPQAPRAAFTQTGAATGNTGASFHQTGAATSPTQGSGTLAPAPPAAPPAYTPPDMSGNKWMAYLSPDQLDSLNQTTLKNQQGINDWNNKVGTYDPTTGFVQNPNGTAEQAYQQSMNAAQQAADQQTQQANNEMAARGMFQSSIRANDLTDIQRTRVERQGLALSTLNSLIADATSAITALNGSTSSAMGAAQGFAAINAAAQAAPPPPAAPTPPAASGTPPRAPTPTAPSGPRGTTGASFHQTGAATAPNRPPTVGRGQIGYHGGF